MFEIDIHGYSLQKKLGVLKGDLFEGLGVQMMPRRPAG